MTDDNHLNTATSPCDPIPFTEDPTDLVNRLTREVDRRCDHAQGAAVAVPLAHRVVLARREA